MSNHRKVVDLLKCDIASCSQNIESLNKKAKDKGAAKATANNLAREKKKKEILESMYSYCKKKSAKIAELEKLQSR